MILLFCGSNCGTCSQEIYTHMCDCCIDDCLCYAYSFEVVNAHGTVSLNVCEVFMHIARHIFPKMAQGLTYFFPAWGANPQNTDDENPKTGEGV